MSLTRRQVAAAFGALFPSFARAQTWPARPLRIIVGFPAGGTIDVVARLAGDYLSRRLGQPVIIENRLGAGGNIGTEAVAHAAPDGYTLLAVTSANAISDSLYTNLNFNFVRDFAPIAHVLRVPLVVVVTPGLPIKTISELIAYAKANPAKLNMASAGNGGIQHVAGELFKKLADIEMTHVPYRGAAPAEADLIAGNVQVMVDTLPAVVEFIRSGKLRALAVTTATRQETLPGTPVVADTIPGFEATSFNGLAAPKGTPPEIIARLNALINEGLNEPDLRAKLASQGVPYGGSAAEFAALIKEEADKWADVVRFSGAKPD